jgi:cell division protein FtsN
MKKKFLILSVGLSLSLILTGCNLPGRATPTTQVDLLNTAAAQTIQAQQTNIVQTNQAGVIETTPTATLEPQDEETPSATPEPSDTPAPTPTHTQETACNQAAFVSETVPDGTDYDPGETFTKTWSFNISV